MMLPPSVPNAFTASLHASRSPRTFRLKCSWNCSSVTSSIGAITYIPALLTRTSSRPNAFLASAKRRVTSAATETSPCTAIARPPPFFTSATTLSAPARLDA